MRLLLGIGCVLAALWALSRLGVWLIERRWPALGSILRVDGAQVHVADVPAESARPPLLLIHGASGNLRDPLEALSGALGGRFRLIAADRPGHGYTSRRCDAMSDPARQADLIAAALAALAAPPCIALGHSWGASVAAALAQRHPDRVAGLVLLAPATHPWPGGIALRTRFFALPYIGPALTALCVVPLGLALAPPAIRVIFAPAAPPAGYLHRIGALLAIRPATFVANARDVVDFYGHLVRLSARYGEIRVPTEVLTGDTDPIVSPTIHAYGLVRDIPAARLTVLPGAGHMPHWTRSAEVAEAVERVAARAVAGAAGN